LVTAAALRHYDPWANDRRPLDDAALVTVQVMAVATVLALVRGISPDVSEPPSIGAFLSTFWPAVMLARIVGFRRFSREEGALEEVLIVGTGSLARLTAQDLICDGRHRVLGYLRFGDERKTPSLNASFLGDTGELEHILKTVPVGEVYIAGNALRQGEAMQAAIKVCERFGVPFALPAASFRFDRARPVEECRTVDGYIHYLSHDSKPCQMAVKRLFDIVASAVAVWMLIPLFVFVAVAIKLTSRGPIFFKQLRVGLNGKPFHMLKFRSMIVNADALKEALARQNEQAGPVFKMKNDPRVTRIGRFIRKYSIDELPQLINVLRGDMSVVGPRPPVPTEVAKYESWQRRRLSVRPGLTCIWQVSGRNQISFEDWMYLDMRYIDHWTLLGDFQLIFRTVPVVLTGRGAS
jgi:exopolysaccharide biosynthesis polyprenyl glycosylphosphotransferase